MPLPWPRHECLHSSRCTAARRARKCRYENKAAVLAALLVPACALTVYIRCRLIAVFTLCRTQHGRAAKRQMLVLTQQRSYAGPAALSSCSPEATPCACGHGTWQRMDAEVWHCSVVTCDGIQLVELAPLVCSHCSVRREVDGSEFFFMRHSAWRSPDFVAGVPSTLRSCSTLCVVAELAVCCY